MRNEKCFLFSFLGKESVFLEKFELVVCLRWGFPFSTDEVNTFAKLFVGHFDNGDKSFDGYKFFDAIDVHGAGFIAGAVPNVHGKLHHGESVFDQVFPKPRRRFALNFCFSG